MRKEIATAVVVGILFGAIFAYGIWRVNAIMKAPKAETRVLSTTIDTVGIQTPTPPQTLSFELIKPPEYQVFEKPSVVVKGVTLPGIWIFVSSEDKDSMFKANDDGSFEKTVSLIPGINLVRITIFDNGGNSYSHEVPVLHSSTFPVDTDKSPSDAYAYVGIVTDKTETSMQVTDEKGVIKFVSIDPASIVVSKNITTKEIAASYADVAIGDVVASLGYKGQNGVLDTKQVLLGTSPQKSVRHAQYGRIKSVGRNTITIVSKDDTEFTIQIPRTILLTTGLTLSKASFSDFEVDQRILVSGEQNGSTITARIIHII